MRNQWWTHLPLPPYNAPSTALLPHPPKPSNHKKSSQNIQPRLQTSKNYIPESTFSILEPSINNKHQGFRGQLQLLMTYLFLASIISKEALGLTNAWQAGPAHLAKGRNQMSGVMDLRVMNTAGLYPSQSVKFWMGRSFFFVEFFWIDGLYL